MDAFSGEFSKRSGLSSLAVATFSASNKAVSWDTTGAFSRARCVGGERGLVVTSSDASTSTSAEWSRHEVTLEGEPRDGGDATKVCLPLLTDCLTGADFGVGSRVGILTAFERSRVRAGLAIFGCGEEAGVEVRRGFDGGFEGDTKARGRTGRGLRADRGRRGGTAGVVAAAEREAESGGFARRSLNGRAALGSMAVVASEGFGFLRREAGAGLGIFEGGLGWARRAEEVCAAIRKAEAVGELDAGLSGGEGDEALGDEAEAEAEAGAWRGTVGVERGRVGVGLTKRSHLDGLIGVLSWSAGLSGSLRGFARGGDGMAVLGADLSAGLLDGSKVEVGRRLENDWRVEDKTGSLLLTVGCMLVFSLSERVGIVDRGSLGKVSNGEMVG